ncbi:MAG: DUF502 domain-containing protein [Planctomycetota bacterium]|jgi:uncharacterized membrane protein|nr:DUF502 domain-containing protein [Planctomycetota bacterium]
MTKLSRWFINGLLAVLPISITVYVTWWIASLAENVFGAPLRTWMGVRADQTGYYFFGLGLLFMIVILIFVGLFLEFYLGKLLMSWSERLLSRIPGVKQVYSSIKEILDFFNPDRKKTQNNYMVIVDLLDHIRVLGYVTRDTMDTFRNGQLGGRDEVVVILPFCYQMGGNSIIVPRDRVRPLDLSFEDGMKIAISGFVLSGDDGSDSSQSLPPILKKSLQKEKIAGKERDGV